jgi:hypothetical protein
MLVSAIAFIVFLLIRRSYPFIRPIRKIRGPFFEENHEQNEFNE